MWLRENPCPRLPEDTNWSKKVGMALTRRPFAVVSWVCSLTTTHWRFLLGRRGMVSTGLTGTVYASACCTVKRRRIGNAGFDPHFQSAYHLVFCKILQQTYWTIPLWECNKGEWWMVLQMLVRWWRHQSRARAGFPSTAIRQKQARKTTPGSSCSAQQCHKSSWQVHGGMKQQEAQRPDTSNTSSK